MGVVAARHVGGVATRSVGCYETKYSSCYFITICFCVEMKVIKDGLSGLAFRDGEKGGSGSESGAVNEGAFS